MSPGHENAPTAPLQVGVVGLEPLGLTGWSQAGPSEQLPEGNPYRLSSVPSATGVQVPPGGLGGHCRYVTLSTSAEFPLQQYDEKYPSSVTPGIGKPLASVVRSLEEAPTDASRASWRASAATVSHSFINTPKSITAAISSVKKTITPPNSTTDWARCLARRFCTGLAEQRWQRQRHVHAAGDGYGIRGRSSTPAWRAVREKHVTYEQQ